MLLSVSRCCRTLIACAAVAASSVTWAEKSLSNPAQTLHAIPSAQLEALAKALPPVRTKGTAPDESDLLFRGNNEPLRTITGTVLSADRMETDNDTNDPTSPLIPNDDFGQEWSLPNPVTVGGFVTFDGTAVDGDRFGGEGDPFDVYALSLSAGQTVVLDISDYDLFAPAGTDLDLYLFDANDTSQPIDASETLDPLEIVQAPASGQYIVAVFAFEGSSNYVLRADTVSSSAAAKSEVVPEQVVVGLRDGHYKSAQSWVDAFNAKSGFGLEVSRTGGQGTVLLELGSSKALADAAKRVNPFAPDDAITARSRVWAAAKMLMRDESVAFAEPNYIWHPFATTNDPQAPLQWHYSNISLQQAWDVTTGDPDVVVAVIDTGVSLHRDLAANLTNDGYDTISLLDIAVDGDGPDPDASDPGDQNNPDGSSSFHGTHVAGTVAAVSNNNLDVAGVAYGSRVMPIRVLGKGGGTSFDITQGILYSGGVANDTGALPTNPADVINLSLGGGSPSTATQNAVNAVRAQGVIVIAAAGNESTSAPSYPASYPGVVSVSATDVQNELAPYSNFGAFIDVAAPGGNTSVDLTGDNYADGVLSTAFDDSGGTAVESLVFYQGTSMASPHVAGVAALMRSVDPNLSPNDFDALLASGNITQDLLNDGPGRNDTFGHGLIDAFKAVNEASQGGGGGTDVPPILQVTPASLNFGATNNAAEMVAANVGTGTLNIQNVTWNSSWLTVSPPSQVNGTLVYPVSVNRSGLVESTYTDTITFTTDIPSTVTVPVSMSVGTQSVRYGGRQYILLVDIDTFETLGGLAGTPDESGTYSYQFTDVVEDNYYIFIGTDSDNDFFICDEGEACGAYPDITLPEIVDVSGGSVALPPFVTSYPTSLGSFSKSRSRRAIRIPESLRPPDR